VAGLSKDKAQEFEEVAALRNSVGVQPDLKAKWVQPSFLWIKSDLHLSSRQADKNFVNVAKKFMDDIFKQMGVQVFMLVGYQNSEGDVVRSKYVS
jgi:hypothetical protein